MTQVDPAALADNVVRDVLATQWDGVPALVIKSPPGAGKTGVAERLSVQSVALMHQRAMVATQTNEQAFDLSRRLGVGFSKLPFYMMVTDKLEIPRDIASLANVRIVHRSGDLPNGPCVVIGNSAKWSWFDADHCQFDVQIVDEAYQLPDYRFHLIAGLASRHVLIGDPGQIDPVIQAELERWRCDPAGPHVPAPRSLIERYPNVTQVTLPVSRRLVRDSVKFVQPAFYPNMPFIALHQARPLRFARRGIVPMDTPLDAAASGQTLLMVQLPALMVGEVDLELADEMASTIGRILTRGASFQDEQGIHTVTPSMIGVACAHVAQVNAVRERLGPPLRDVFVETANRFQGLERQLMFIQHPLSGRADATEFHLDAGRLCVLLSRHRVACWIFGREGITRQLQRYAPSGDRSLAISDDPEFEGWRANTELMRALAERGRIYAVPAGSSGRTA
jgi:hypothetical protein